MTTTLRNFALWLTLCLILFPAHLIAAEASALVEAGQVIAGSGQISAQLIGEPERRLKRRDLVFKGDTIRVGGNGFLQLRFSDGGLIALRPNSEFRIDDYHYAGQQDGNEKAVFKLVRGGLRAISGKIGKKHKDNYQLDTPVATIGIRGTDYQVTLVCQGTCSMGGYVFKGGIYATGDGGKIVLDGDQAFVYPGDGSPPRMISKEEFDAMVATADAGDGNGNGNGDGDGGESGNDGESGSGDGDGGDDGNGTGADGGENGDGNGGAGGGTGLGGTGGDDGSAQPPDFSSTGGKTADDLSDLDEDTPADSPADSAPMGSAVAGASITQDGEDIGGGSGTIIHDGVDREIYLASIGGNDNVVTLARDAADPECSALECGAGRGTATLADYGQHTDSGTTWGTWVGGWESLDGESPLGRLHWMFNAHPTPQASLDGLKLQNYTAVFNYLGGTTPTNQSGTVGSYWLNPRMIVQFGSNMITDYRVGVIFEGAVPESDDDDTFFYGGLASPVAISGPEVDFDLDTLAALPNAQQDDHIIYSGSGNAGIVFTGADAAYALNSFGMRADVDSGTISTAGTALLGTENNAGNPDVSPYGIRAPYGSVAGIAGTLYGYVEEHEIGYGWSSDAEFSENAFEMELFLDNATDNNLTAILNPATTGDDDLENTLIGDATLVDTGNSGMYAKGPPLPWVTWGRWSGAWEAERDWMSDIEPTGDLHFIYSDEATPASVVASLGYTAQFRHIAGTTPTNRSGVEGSYFLTPRFAVDFASQQIVSYGVGVEYLDGTRILGHLYQAEDLEIYDNDIDLDLIVSVSAPGSSYEMGYWGEAGIYFVGSNASHAVSTYVMEGGYWDEGAEQHVDVSAMGASMLANEGTPENLGRAAAVAAIWSDGSDATGVATVIREDGALNEVDTAAAGDDPNSVTRIRHVELGDPIGCAPYCELDRAEATTPVDTGNFDDGAVQANWGRWGNGWTATRNGGDRGTPMGSMHYMTSDDVTSQTQLSAISPIIAFFKHIGGTAPTDAMGNTGTYTNDPNMTVSFGGNGGTTITAYNAGVQFENTGRSFDISLAQSASVGTSNVTELDLALSADGTGCATGCAGTGAGGVTFLGSEASHAITTFGGAVRDNDGVGNIVDGVVGTSLMENTGAQPD